MFTIPNELIVSFKQTLENKPVYSAIQNKQNLCCFMEHHLFSVRDFISLVKYQSYANQTEAGEARAAGNSSFGGANTPFFMR